MQYIALGKRRNSSSPERSPNWLIILLIYSDRWLTIKWIYICWYLLPTSISVPHLAPMFVSMLSTPSPPFRTCDGCLRNENKVFWYHQCAYDPPSLAPSLERIKYQLAQPFPAVQMFARCHGTIGYVLCFRIFSNEWRKKLVVFNWRRKNIRVIIRMK